MNIQGLCAPILVLQENVSKKKKSRTLEEAERTLMERARASRALLTATYITLVHSQD